MMLKKTSHTLFLAVAIIAGLISQNTVADTRTYQATTDFPIIDAGAVPYYSEEPDRPSLAINAAIEAYRDVFAQASVVYDGSEGLHDLTLVALAELDGEADYRILINGVVVGEASNPEVTVDYTVVRHTFENLNVPAGATIAVESLANTNGKIPEGDGTAFARGRWTALELLDTADSVPVPTDIDLEISLSSNKQSLEQNESFDIELTVANAANSITATQPVVSLAIALEAVEIVSADQCTQNVLGLSCNFPEITAGQSQSMTLSFNSTDELVVLVVQATVEADQNDRNGSNDAASINVGIIDGELDPEPVSENSPDNNTSGNTNSGSGSSGGALAIFWFLFGLPLVLRRSSYSK